LFICLKLYSTCVDELDRLAELLKRRNYVIGVRVYTGGDARVVINPETGQSVVIDNSTGEVIHVGGPGFQYGPGSGDVP
jgi:hypothetical protein